MSEYNITSANYVLDMDGNNTTILATINGVVLSVPMDLRNRHYAEIVRQVDAGELVVQPAE